MNWSLTLFYHIANLVTWSYQVRSDFWFNFSFDWGTVGSTGFYTGTFCVIYKEALMHVLTRKRTLATNQITIIVLIHCAIKLSQYSFAIIYLSLSFHIFPVNFPTILVILGIYCCFQIVSYSFQLADTYWKSLFSPGSLHT